MIGLAAGFLPALPWPDYLGLDAFASDAEAKAARPRARAPPAAPASRRAGPPCRARSTSCLSEQLGLGRPASIGDRTGMLDSRQHELTGRPRLPARAPRARRRALAAELFVDCLENEGVEFVFGIPGEETLDLNEALDRSQLITFVPTRHEQGAAFMADAYGRLTGKPGVCLATLGPGATQPGHRHRRRDLDHAPLVALTGQTGLAGMHKETRTSSSTPSRCCGP